MKKDWTSLQEYLIKFIHPHILFKIRDNDGIFPTKIRTTVIFGSGATAHFAETELNLANSDTDLEEWYESCVKNLTIQEANKIINDDEI